MKLKLTEDIEAAVSFRYLAQAYEQISVMKMQKVRQSVLKTREFMDRLSDVFLDVKGSYKDKIMQLIKKKKQVSKVATFSTLPKNGRSVAVFISANARLYGDIIFKVFKSFMEFVSSQKDADLVVVGKLGRELYEGQAGRKAQYFDIPDSDVTFEDLKPLITTILNYQKVTVFYGQFLNVLNQVPKGLDITGEQPVEEENSGRDFHFLFEPSLENILNFFETQIFTSSFKQTVNEAQLARYGSRITAMEEALVNIDGMVKNLKYKKLRVEKDIQNKKQQQTVSGIALWNR